MNTKTEVLDMLFVVGEASSATSQVKMHVFQYCFYLEQISLKFVQYNGTLTPK